MRTITAAQLIAELQVGTVDLSEVEVIDTELTNVPVGAPVTHEDPQPEPVAGPVVDQTFAQRLKAQAEAAKATAPVDVRASAAVALADAEKAAEKAELSTEE